VESDYDDATLNGNKSDLDEDTAAVRDYSNISRSTDKTGLR
jgi:hypothetical protein